VLVLVSSGSFPFLHTPDFCFIVLLNRLLCVNRESSLKFGTPLSTATWSHSVFINITENFRICASCLFEVNILE